MKNYVILFCILFISIGLKANNLLSSSISYSYKNDSIKAVLNVNTECKYGSLSGMEGVIYNDINNDSFVFDFVFISKKDITPKCHLKDKSYCEDPVNNIGEGVIESKFEKEINFKDGVLSTWKRNGACKFYIGWRAKSNSKRSLSHTNGLEGTAYYSELMIDLCVLESSSTNSNTSPETTSSNILHFCLFNSAYFNNGALDLAEYDSLSFESVNPLEGHKVDAVYTSPFTKDYPITTSRPLYVDPISGDLVFWDPYLSENSQATIKIMEWRKDTNGTYVQLGYQYRDIYIKAKDCGYNWPPTVESDSFQYVVMEGDKITIDIFSQDIPHPSDSSKMTDTVELSWDYGIPNGSFKILDPSSKTKSAKFEWQTKFGDFSDVPYIFFVTSQDHRCPVMMHAQTSRGFSVRVLRFPLSAMESKVFNLNLYPNPTKDKVTITLPANEKYQSVRILSMDGKVLYDAEVQASSATLELNSSFLSKGVYMIELYTENGIFRGRVIKE